MDHRRGGITGPDGRAPSRRDFLKAAGVGVAGTVVLGGVVTGLGRGVRPASAATQTLSLVATDGYATMPNREDDPLYIFGFRDVSSDPDQSVSHLVATYKGHTQMSAPTPQTTLPNDHHGESSGITTHNANYDTDDVSQPNSSLIQANPGERVLLRLADLGYQQHAMQLPGIPLHVIGQDASLLRDGTTDTSYWTNPPPALPWPCRGWRRRSSSRSPGSKGSAATPSPWNPLGPLPWPHIRCTSSPRCCGWVPCPHSC
jgi:TAT (twin-arginine translocation) pathway-exported protein